MNHRDVTYIVNYSNSNLQRTTKVESFPRLREAREFAADQLGGYIVRHTDESCRLMEFFGGFEPSAQEEDQIKAICT